MPLYSYECTVCHRCEEQVRRIGDRHRSYPCVAPLCVDGLLKLVVSVPATPVIAMGIHASTRQDWNQKRRETLLARSARYDASSRGREERASVIERQAKAGNLPPQLASGLKAGLAKKK